MLPAALICPGLWMLPTVSPKHSRYLCAFPTDPTSQETTFSVGKSRQGSFSSSSPCYSPEVRGAPSQGLASPPGFTSDLITAASESYSSWSHGRHGEGLLQVAMQNQCWFVSGCVFFRSHAQTWLGLLYQSLHPGHVIFSQLWRVSLISKETEIEWLCHEKSYHFKNYASEVRT